VETIKGRKEGVGRERRGWTGGMEKKETVDFALINFQRALGLRSERSAFSSVCLWRT